jgi:uncharacterized membrane protein YraQ (UPF0718 family)
MEYIRNLAVVSVGQVFLTLQHNWPYLIVSVVIASLLKLYVDAAKVSAFLNRYRGASIVTATAAAVATPLCSCGTTAVILDMMASRMTWAPIVAFMVSSPLTSPEGLVYSAGLFGWPFAWAFYLASIILGLAGGAAAAILESSGWLANQTRFYESTGDKLLPASNRVFSEEIPLPRIKDKVTGNELALNPPKSSCGCNSSNKGNNPTTANATGETPSRRWQVSMQLFLVELYNSGSRLLVMFLGFAFIGYFLNGLIPSTWVSLIFGSGNIYSVPLAATLGLPLYINSEASLPLIRSLLDNGMSQGAALAFLISGAGTSIGAITGALTIARWRVIGLVVAILWVGAIFCGFAFDLVLGLKLF